MSVRQVCVIFISALFFALGDVAYVSGAEQEGIVHDPATGDYVVTYRSGYSGKLNTVIFVPATKIEPILKSKFRLTKGTDPISYEYKVKNGSRSRQNIDMLFTTLSSIEAGGQGAPNNWDVNVVGDPIGAGVRLSWTFRGEDDLGGLLPGYGLNKFAIESKDLPGITMMRITGARPVIEWLGHFPAGTVGEQMDRIIENDFVLLPAAVPHIPVPDPFDPVAVLASLRAHVKDDWVAMELLDPDLAVKLDEGFAAALEAARRGNTDGLRRELKALRHQLKGFGKWDEDDRGEREGKQEHDDTPEDRIKTKDWPHPIAKLAARVLDFDLKYIEKRVKGRLE